LKAKDKKKREEEEKKKSFHVEECSIHRIELEGTEVEYSIGRKKERGKCSNYTQSMTRRTTL